MNTLNEQNWNVALQVLKPASELKTLPITALHPFKDHPYKVQDNEEMDALVESIRENGIMSPLIVRPMDGVENEYEVVSGHRRLHAAEKAGITEVPALIYALDHDAAAIAVVDSNLHREHILPSEKAFAYKMKLESLKHQGKRTDLTFNVQKPNHPVPTNPYAWKDTTVDGILANRKYTGCMVSLKTSTISYKVHKVVRKPEEDWSIIPNAQEPIIDENTWLRVQELRKNKRRVTATGRTSLFSGLVFCPDCGSKLHFCASKSLKRDQEFFRCAKYKSGRGECTIHFIRDVVLEQIVLAAVSDLSDFVCCHEAFFLQMVAQERTRGKEMNQKTARDSIVAGNKRIDELDRLIARIYEDNLNGKLSDERYNRMAAGYEREQRELLQSVAQWEQDLRETEKETVDLRMLLNGLREYASMRTLTPELINTIIRRIEIHNPEKVNGQKRVKVDIYFTGVGLVDLPAISEMLVIAGKNSKTTRPA